MVLWVGSVLGVLACVYRPEPPKPMLSDDVIYECKGCPITDMTCGAYAHFLAMRDLVVEGELLGFSGEGRERRARHLVRQVLVGFTRAETLSTILPRYREELLAPRTRTLVWKSRDSEIAGNFAIIPADDRILFNYTKPEGPPRARKRRFPPVKYAPVKRAVLKTKTALSLFDGAEAVLLARLHGNGRWPIPENGGTWTIDSLVRVLGSPKVVPTSVSFGRPHANEGLMEVRPDDLFLIPVPHGFRDSTLAIGVFSRPLVVRNGISIGFGVSVDSLDQAFDIQSGGVRVRHSVH